LSSSLQAVELNDGVKNFNFWVEQFNTNKLIQNKCLNSNQTINMQALINNCASELCGNANPYRSVFLNNDNIEMYVSPENVGRFSQYEQRYRRFINEAINKTKKLHNLFNQRPKNRFSIDWSKLSNEEVDTIAGAVYQNFYKIFFDEKENLISKRVQTVIGDTKDLPPAVKMGLRSFISDALNRYRKNLYYGALHGVPRLSEIKPIIYTRWSLFLQYFESLRFQSPTYYREKLSYVKELDQKIKTTKYEIPADLALDLYQINKLENNSSMPNRKDDANIQYRCKSDICRRGLEVFLNNSNLRNKINFIPKITSQEAIEMKENSLTSCKAGYLLNYRDQYNKDYLRNKLPKILSNFKSALKTKLSHETLVKLNYFIKDTAQFNFESKKNDASNVIDQDFQNSLKEAEENIMNISANPTNTTELLKSLNELAKTQSICSWGNEGITWDNITPPSNRDEKNKLEDYQPNKNNISISHFSCTHGELGENIVYHELGHLLTYFFKQAKVSHSSWLKYMNLRQCINDQNSKEYTLQYSHNPPNSFPGDTYRTEEDMADLIQDIVNQVHYPNDRQKLNCHFLPVQNNQYYKLSLDNKLKMNSHSSEFTRLLRNALRQKKMLPPSCSKIIEINPKRFKKCI
jgi:hypothetical protein